MTSIVKNIEVKLNGREGVKYTETGTDLVGREYAHIVFNNNVQVIAEPYPDNPELLGFIVLNASEPISTDNVFEFDSADPDDGEYDELYKTLFDVAYPGR